MSAFKYQWNQTIDVGTAGLLSKQWTSIRHILSLPKLLVTANACVHVTAYVAVRRSLSTTYTAVVLGLLLRQYVSYQFGVWAGTFETNGTDSWRRLLQKFVRAGRGSRPWTDGRDGPSGMDFWNKRHGFLAPIVSKVCQIWPWGRAVDGWPWRAFISPTLTIPERRHSNTTCT